MHICNIFLYLIIKLFRSFLAEAGGSLGLFLGFSFLTLWDIFIGFLKIFFLKCDNIFVWWNLQMSATNLSYINLFLRVSQNHSYISKRTHLIYMTIPGKSSYHMTYVIIYIVILWYIYIMILFDFIHCILSGDSANAVPH